MEDKYGIIIAILCFCAFMYFIFITINDPAAGGRLFIDIIGIVLLILLGLWFNRIRKEGWKNE